MLCKTPRNIRKISFYAIRTYFVVIMYDITGYFKSP